MRATAYEFAARGASVLSGIRNVKFHSVWPEVPMERRLPNLSLDAAARDKSAVNQNLTRLLVQGLHSNDPNILEMVLHSSTRGAASLTAAHLPPEYLPPLLEHLATLAPRHTATCATVCVWVSAILRSHAAFLLATMNAGNAERLASLLATFRSRRSHLCQLLNVSGRLQFTLAQRAERRDAPHDRPVIEYNDESSDEEMEVERQSGSDASFDEQDFNDDGDSDSDSAVARHDSDSDGGGE